MDFIAAGSLTDVSSSAGDKGAPEQIVDLVELARGVSLPPPVKKNLLMAWQTALARPGNKSLACAALSGFMLLVQRMPPTAIADGSKALMIEDANRIKGVLGCP